MEIDHMVYQEDPETTLEEPTNPYIDPNDEWALEVNAVLNAPTYQLNQDRKCYHCGSDKHLMANCPHPPPSRHFNGMRTNPPPPRPTHNPNRPTPFGQKSPPRKYSLAVADVASQMQSLVQTLDPEAQEELHQALAKDPEMHPFQDF